MNLEGNLVIERTRTKRWVSIVAVTVPVFIVVAVAAWFIRAFVAPPMATIPAPMVIAAAPPPPPAPVPEARPPSPPEPTQALPAAAQEGAAPLPMFGSFTLAPPNVSLRTAPRPNVEPDPSAGAEPAAPASNPVVTAHAGAASAPEMSEPAAASHEPTEPATSAVPLPPPRPRMTVALNNGRVPLPRPRPAAEATSPATEGEQRMFNAHAVE